MMHVARAFVWVGLLTVAAIPVSLTAQSLSSIKGIVTDQTGAMIPNARVTFQSSGESSLSAHTTTDKFGRFHIEPLHPGQYILRAEAAGFGSTTVPVSIGAGEPTAITVVLQVQPAQQSILVEGSGIDAQSSSRAHAEIDSSLIAAIPSSSVNGGFSSALTLGTPGVAADSNGSFHPLGEHAEVSFNVDGQPITDQQSRTFSNQVSLNTVQSIDVINGAPPAEFGDKTSMTVRAVTRSGLDAGASSGSVSFGYGTFGTGTTDLTLLVGNAKLGNFLAASGARSGRFLDTPEFAPLHAIGNSESIFDRFDLQPTVADSLHVNFSVAQSWFQSPNTFVQQQGEQDQRQSMHGENLSAAYSHTFSAARLLNANAWWRGDHVQYYPSARVSADQPATFSQDRSLVNFGARTDLSFSKKHHNVKTGLLAQWTPLHEQFATGLTDPAFNSPCADAQGVTVPDPALSSVSDCAAKGYLANSGFQPSLLQYDLSRGGGLFQFNGRATIKEQSAYIQDSMSFGRLGINAGLRGDRYEGISHKSALQPRAGASYQVPGVGTVLRASYARIMATPYNENLVLSSATGPGGLASGALGTATVVPLVPGSRNQFNAGFSQAIGTHITADAEYFWKFTDGAFDFNVVLNTPLNFPVQFRKAKIDGAMARVTLSPVHGFSAFTIMGHTRSRLFSPEIGGINFGTQYSPVARPDHDQAFQQTTFLRYQPTAKAPWVGFTWRFDSGLVAVSVPDYVTALTLSGDEQAQMGLYCGRVFAAVGTPLRSCTSPVFGATRVNIVTTGTYDPDRNPSRIVPRNLFDIAAGLDNIWHSEPYHLDAKLVVTNLTNKVALYNFLSSFSGTHFITPRSIQAELTLRF